MQSCRIAGMMTILFVLPFLQGCTAAMIVSNAFPAIIGGGAVLGAEDRSPFRIPVDNLRPQNEVDLAVLDAKIQKAECGDAQSQYWLASVLQNNFNTTPNKVEIYKWYRLAESGRYDPATEKLRILAETMPEADITQAQQRAQAWQVNTEGC